MQTCREVVGSGWGWLRWLGVVGGEQTRGDVDNLRGSQINRRLRCPSFRTAPRVESGNVLPFPRQPLPPSPSSLAVHAQDTVVALGLRLDCVGRGACLGRVCVCVGGGGHAKRGGRHARGRSLWGQRPPSRAQRINQNGAVLQNAVEWIEQQRRCFPLTRPRAPLHPDHKHPSTQTTSTPPPRPRAPLTPATRPVLT